jgi:hypothetical protein
MVLVAAKERPYLTARRLVSHRFAFNARWTEFRSGLCVADQTRLRWSAEGGIALDKAAHHRHLHLIGAIVYGNNPSF